MVPKTRSARQNAPGSFIFVLDNILEEGEESYMSKGQRLRHRETLEILFERAGLKIFRTFGPFQAATDFYPVMIWALH